MTIAITVTVPWEYRGETYQIECRVWPGKPPVPYPGQPFHLKNVPEVEAITGLMPKDYVNPSQRALCLDAADTTSDLYIAAVEAARLANEGE